MWGAVRADVIDYLARAKDPAALPELRRSLGAGDPMEIRAAIRGVVALKDKASRPAVTKLKEHPDKEVARVAEEALAAF